MELRIIMKPRGLLFDQAISLMRAGKYQAVENVLSNIEVNYENLLDSDYLLIKTIRNKNNYLIDRIKKKPVKNHRPNDNCYEQNNKRLVIIENGNSFGDPIKKEISFALNNIGYHTISIGRNVSYCDYNQEIIEYNSDDLSVNKTIDLNYECLATFRRENPSLSYRSCTNNDEIWIDLHKRYLNLYYTVKTFLEQNDDVAFGVIWGGYLLESKAARFALEAANVNTYATEYSFDKTKIYFEPKGIIGNKHSMSEKQTLNNLTHYEKAQIYQWVKSSNHAKPGQPAKNTHDINDVLSKDSLNVLLICQCFVDAVDTYDSPFFPSTISAYEEIFKTIKSIDNRINLVIKLHPGDIMESKLEISKIARSYGFKNIIGLENNINIYDLMKKCDVGICINSQAGLEMLAHGKNVLTLGNAFYIGHGFGLCLKDYNSIEEAINDLLIKKLNKNQQNLINSYLHKYLFNYLISRGKNLEEELKLLTDPPWIKKTEKRLLIVHPSGSNSGSGFYLQDISEKLVQLGWSVVIVCEGSCQISNNGVRWYKLKFDGARLNQKLKDTILEFQPNILLQVGVRTKPMRAALEIYASTKVNFIVQAEDDEESAFLKYYPKADKALIELLDSPTTNKNSLKKFIGHINLDETLKIISLPDHNRWVEPIMRVACYKLAKLHCCIWHPMAQRLYDKFRKKTFILPPVVDFDYYENLEFSKKEIEKFLHDNNINPNSHILFVGGTIYDFSDEFKLFIEGVKQAATRTKTPITLAVAGRSRNTHVINYAEKKLKDCATFRSLEIPNDENYHKMLYASDVICSPGINDVFNKYRLSARLVKAIAMKKPILTFKSGFGESLDDFVHGYLSHEDTPESWSNLIIESLDEEKRSSIGIEANKFLRPHLDAKNIALKFSRQMENIISDNM